MSIKSVLEDFEVTEILGYRHKLETALLAEFKKLVPERDKCKNEDAHDEIMQIGWNACRSQILQNISAQEKGENITPKKGMGE